MNCPFCLTEFEIQDNEISFGYTRPCYNHQPVITLTWSPNNLKYIQFDYKNLSVILYMEDNRIIIEKVIPTNSPFSSFPYEIKKVLEHSTHLSNNFQDILDLIDRLIKLQVFS